MQIHPGTELAVFSELEFPSVEAVDAMRYDPEAIEFAETGCVQYRLDFPLRAIKWFELAFALEPHLAEYLPSYLIALVNTRLTPYLDRAGKLVNGVRDEGVAFRIRGHLSLIEKDAAGIDVILRRDAQTEAEKLLLAEALFVRRELTEALQLLLPLAPSETKLRLFTQASLITGSSPVLAAQSIQQAKGPWPYILGHQGETAIEDSIVAELVLAFQNDNRLEALDLLEHFASNHPWLSYYGISMLAHIFLEIKEAYELRQAESALYNALILYIARNCQDLQL